MKNLLIVLGLALSSVPCFADLMSVTAFAQARSLAACPTITSIVTSTGTATATADLGGNVCSTHASATVSGQEFTGTTSGGGDNSNPLAEGIFDFTLTAPSDESTVIIDLFGSVSGGNTKNAHSSLTASLKMNGLLWTDDLIVLDEAFAWGASGNTTAYGGFAVMGLTPNPTNAELVFALESDSVDSDVFADGIGRFSVLFVPEPSSLIIIAGPVLLGVLRFRSQAAA